MLSLRWRHVTPLLRGRLTVASRFSSFFIRPVGWPSPLLLWPAPIKARSRSVSGHLLGARRWLVILLAGTQHLVLTGFTVGARKALADGDLGRFLPPDSPLVRVWPPLPPLISLVVGGFAVASAPMRPLTSWFSLVAATIPRSVGSSTPCYAYIVLSAVRFAEI